MLTFCLQFTILWQNRMLYFQQISRLEKNFSVLSQCPLFAGVKPEELREMLRCLQGNVLRISRGCPIFLEGDPARFIGIVLSGSVQVVRDDFYANRIVLTAVAPGELFGEAFACAGVEALPVQCNCPAKRQSSAAGLQQGSVWLFLRLRVPLPVDSESSAGHFPKKSHSFPKIRCMSQKTTREKLMEYLLEQAKQQGQAEFVIPFDRPALADYLGVERSAMLAEIGKLKRQGVLDTAGSRFRVFPQKGP